MPASNPTQPTLGSDSGLCECGCLVKPTTGRYVRGHAMKLKGFLLARASRGDEVALVELRRRGWLRTTLPTADNRRFGVEIEFFLPYSTNLTDIVTKLNAAGVSTYSAGYTHEVTNRWKIVTDGSLYNSGNRNGSGYELVSPPMRGEAGLAQIDKALKVLTEAGCFINKSCGLHVHHEATDLSLDALKKTAVYYTEAKNVINKFFSKSRVNNQYARNYSSYELDDLNAKSSLSSFKDFARYINRYRTVNFNSYAKYGTIEFRQHHGTLNAKKVRAWVLFTQAVIRCAAKSKVLGTTLKDVLDATELSREDRRYFEKRAARRTAPGGPVVTEGASAPSAPAPAPRRNVPVPSPMAPALATATAQGTRAQLYPEVRDTTNNRIAALSGCNCESCANGRVPAPVAAAR